MLKALTFRENSAAAFELLIQFYLERTCNPKTNTRKAMTHVAVTHHINVHNEAQLL